MAVAVFAGSFEPPTFGHLNIIERTSVNKRNFDINWLSFEFFIF